MTGPVHVIAHFTIDDPDGYRRYADAFLPALDGYDGRVVTVDDAVTTLEGEWPNGRTVVLEFSSEDEFRRWWESPGYRAIATDRIEATTTHAVVLVHAPPWS